MLDRRLTAAVSAHPYPLVFLTVSGAHLYGFASTDSDYDLRGAHVVSLPEVLGLEPVRETVSIDAQRDGVQLDVVTHDIRKYFRLLLKRNGYVLEQIYSPLIVHATPEHEELKDVAQRCITRDHAQHYLGFADAQWREFLRESPRRVKVLLYSLRVLLTGIHLMRTGEVEANLARLGRDARLPLVRIRLRRSKG